MVKVDFPEPDTKEWRAWVAQCAREQAKHVNAIEAGEESEVKGPVYKGVKFGIKTSVYMNPTAYFFGKCAYCESRMSENQPGDIEHFRPKNAVRDIKNETVTVDGGARSHPGYYWLAYCWRNLLPSCRDCNSPSKAKTGQLIGKGNRFPVEGNEYACRSGEELRERPLLINPTIEDPEDHIEVDATGLMHARNGSIKGRTCIDVFGLNVREALVEGRRRAFKKMQNETGLALLAAVNGYPDVQDRLTEFWDAWHGKAPFSAASRAAIRQHLSARAIDLLLQLYLDLADN